MKRTLLSLALAVSMFVIGATASYSDDGGGMRSDTPTGADYGELTAR